PPALPAPEPGRLPDPDPGVHRGLRHAGRGHRSLPRAVPLDPGPLAAGRARRAARVRALLRMRAQPAAVPDERGLAGDPAAVPLPGPDPGAGPPSAPQPRGHD